MNEYYEYVLNDTDTMMCERVIEIEDGGRQQ